jgi:hypothetical protein
VVWVVSITYPSKLARLTRNRKETTETVKKSLEEMVEGCEVLDFPQVRHDFSDTKIYWRRSTHEPVKP